MSTEITPEMLRHYAYDPDVAEYGRQAMAAAAADRIEELEAERREQAVMLTEMERRYSMLRHRARLINDQTQALAELLCPIESAPAAEDTP